MVLTEDFSARPYQVDLFKKAVEANTIIYLPTGSGKTFIAVMLVNKLSASIQKLYSQGGKRTIFAVNTIPLVIQQSEYLARHTGLKAKGFSGDMQVDYWTKEIWLNEIEDASILVMTAQIFVDILSHGVMSLDRINLIVFDECHRAVNDHPMRQIMQRFENCLEDLRPRVLALSATLLNSNVKIDKVEETIKSLETTFHSKVASVESTAVVAGYTTNPKESIVFYSPHETCSIDSEVEKIIEEASKILQIVHIAQSSDNNDSSTVFKPKTKNQKLLNILKDIEEHMQLTGIYGCSQGVLLHMVQLESLKRILVDQQTLLVLEYLLTKMMIIRKFFDNQMQDLTDKEQIYQFSSNKMLKLFAVLKEFNCKKSQDLQFCCIIFVKRRFTAQVLYHVLKNLRNADEEYRFLSPEYMVGYNADPFRNTREVLCISKWNKEVLQRFRTQKSNCIVATDVVDEGIDIPTCTLVIRFDLPMDFRSYIQSKGRARHFSSQYIMIVSSDDDEFRRRLIHFQETESFLHRILLGKTDLRLEPTAADIEDELYCHKIKPYTHCSADGTRCVVTEQSAISLINRYCSTLYKSKFCTLAPTWILHKTANEEHVTEYKVSLELPMMSPLKGTIWGDCMLSIDDAKRSAALKTCVKLKELGELDDQLLPIDRKEIHEDINHLFPNWIDEEKDMNCLPGTYSRKRKHDLNHPEPLYASFPKEDADLFLHIIGIKATYSVPHDNRRLVFYDLLNRKSGFGLLTTKQLPKIPDFPIFMNVGSLDVHIEVNHCEMRLKQENIQSIKTFHTMIFSQVVDVIKPFMIFDNRNLENSFAVVPVNDNWNIDWDVLNTYKEIKTNTPSAPIDVTESEYNLALVSPNYRASPSYYIVTMICDEITADSSFPTDDFYSYVHYFTDRHNLNIQNKKQPMLEVKPVSTTINCIKPRGIKPGLRKRKQADILGEFEEHLVPELCNKIEFPALHWLKATTLPSIIHRITQLLSAECLRQQILKEADFNIHHSGDLWSPLTISEKEVEEKKEPVGDVMVLEESMESDASDLLPEFNGTEVDVLSSEVQYPWSKGEEPVDLHRAVDRIQLIDIEYYHKFMGQHTDKSGKHLPRDDMLQPKQGVTYMSRPNLQVPTLNMLSESNVEGPEPVIIAKALTSKISNDCFDLERLETLGDSFLKLSVSLFLYDSYRNFNEGQLTALKGKIIGNRNLYYCGVSKNIPGKIKVEDFTPKSNFITPAYTADRLVQNILIENEISANVLYELKIPLEERFSGYISDSTMLKIQEKVLSWEDTQAHTGMEHFLGQQTVPDKVVADSVEALIGAYLCTSGTKGALKVLRWFGIIPFSSVVEISSSPMFPCEVDNHETSNVDKHMPWADVIETRLNYKFKNRTLLLQAFSHPSYSDNGTTPCYQRLEFLGDAVLDFLITVYIYEFCGELSPGDLTDLRSALVNNITFACLAVRYGLHTALLAYVPLLHEAISQFVKFLEEKNHAVDDELLWILLEENECNLAEHVDVPKVLGDIFESFIGAIYIDTRKDLSQVWNIIYTLMHKEFELFCSNVPKQPVRMIHETQGAHPRFLKAKLIENTGQVMVPLEVTVHGKLKLFHGFGTNKRQAKSAASKQALKYFRYCT